MTTIADRRQALLDLAADAENLPGPELYRRARRAAGLDDGEFAAALAQLVESVRTLADLRSGGRLGPAEVLGTCVEYWQSMQDGLLDRLTGVQT